MIYLDNSATTPVCSEALEKMCSAATEIYGNPSSLHNAGIEAEKLLSQARKNVLSALGTSEREGKLVFTSCGTEANNLAIFGTVNAKNRSHKKIITDNSQHASVLAPLRRLEEQGIEVVLIGTRNGELDCEMLSNAVDRDTMLCTIMLVNNETGAIYDTAKAFSIVKKLNPDTVCHTDAIQAFHKLNFTPKTLGADLISVSGHKVRAPKGTGALYISNEVIKSKRIVPYILGGGQEGSFRSGTENVPGISAFGEAVNHPFNCENCCEIREYLLSLLPSEIKPNIAVNPAPHIISLTLPSIKSETAVHFLSSKGICTSSGSACSSHGHVGGALEAFGLTAKEADCTIRVSLSGDESKADIDIFISALKEAVSTLVKIR